MLPLVIDTKRQIRLLGEVLLDVPQEAANLTVLA